jgi:hypothetical protein
VHDDVCNEHPRLVLFNSVSAANGDGTTAPHTARKVTGQAFGVYVYCACPGGMVDIDQFGDNLSSHCEWRLWLERRALRQGPIRCLLIFFPLDAGIPA